jgi:hypothetical protein
MADSTVVEIEEVDGSERAALPTIEIH